MNSGFEPDAPSFNPVAHALGPDEVEYDALADLFLSGDPSDAHRPIPFPSVPSEPRDMPDHSEVTIEGLIVGHLPVLASAWVTQYARHRARDLGAPVALLRLRNGRATIDLFVGGQVAEADSLDEAIQAANDAGAAWVVRVDEPDEPRLAEADIDELTLLTGSDQAAIVASYRVIKRLAGIAGADADVAHIRIAAMGSDERAAANIGEKISRAATTFLGCVVEVAAVVDRIEPGRSTTLFDADVDLAIDELVDRIRAPRANEPFDDFEPVASAPTPTFPGPRPSVIESKPTADHPLAGDRPSLASHLAGLLPLPITCPYASEIELARDESGRLHLLALAKSGSIGELLSARAWATVHAQLLSAACSPLDARDAILHLMTSDVPSVRRLLESSIRVHLLAPVDVDGRKGWFCTPLN
jgi:hypothetical protein